MQIRSHIFIASDIEEAVEYFKEELRSSRLLSFVEDTFKIESVKQITAEAYISEMKTKYILIAAKEFTDVAQNALLKLLEEPPSNIEFIIISPTKSNLLPTVRSRLPVIQGKRESVCYDMGLNLVEIKYAEVFDFLKEHSRISKNDAKRVVEALFHRATVIDRLLLSENQLELFDKSYRLIDLNARPQSVFAMLLMSFIEER